MMTRSSRRTRVLLLALLILAELFSTAGIHTPVALAATGPFGNAENINGSASTTSVAWGDVDGDGDLDLLLGNVNQPSQLYRNQNGTLTRDTTWNPTSATTFSVAWGDVDGDGDLDLVLGNYSDFFNDGKPSQLYRNTGGTLTLDTTWNPAKAATTSVAWGDVDGDGDLDLVLGNAYQPSQLYRNQNGTLTLDTSWNPASADTTSIAWGDVDRDGDLDLLLGNYGQPSQLYRNQGGVLTLDTIWNPASATTFSVALGDVDNDGNLDLVLGNSGEASQLYRNHNGTLTLDTSWSPASADTLSVAWGDVDGDGDLDLVLGNRRSSGTGQSSQLYRNQGGTLTLDTSWSPAPAQTRSVAWGDVDGDGDLDLLFGNTGESSLLYRNTGGTLTFDGSWTPASAHTSSVAWGDVDGDGDLDLVLGNFNYLNNTGKSSQLYRNQGGTLTLDTSWSPAPAQTRSVAWGDVDGDGDLDLVLGNDRQPSQLYRNQGGTLTLDTSWSPAPAQTRSVAWGDVDGDGDLDLVLGNINYSNNTGKPSQLYRNQGGTLTLDTSWSPAPAQTSSVAWGDVDGDGDLDLVLGNSGESSQLYRNHNGTLTLDTTWSPDPANTISVAWGDVDGDGDLDLVLGGGPSQLYRNQGGTLTLDTSWKPAAAFTLSVAWGDVDGDGDLDLVLGNANQPSQLYRNQNGTLTLDTTWTPAPAYTESVAWGDVDGDGDLDLLLGNYNQPSQLYRSPRTVKAARSALVHLGQPMAIPPIPSAYGYATATILTSPQITVPYTLTHPASQLVSKVIGQYSLDGGGSWQTAVPTNTETANLHSSPGGTAHTFTWDTFASGVFGQSDTAVFRLIAVPDVHTNPNQVPGPFLYGSNVAMTLPFRMRGTQSQVVRDGQPVAGAHVYRLPAGASSGAKPVAEASGRTFRTNQLGYLEGRGQVALGDRLVALQAITHTEQYTMYFTSAAPTASGLDMFKVTQPGVQTLTVSSQNPLMLLNLSVSLEWDARSDTAFMDRLEDNLQQVSGNLYNWSDGQVALGTVTIYQAKDHWDDTLDASGKLIQKGADIRIRATNSLRPNASQGGITTQDVTETIARSDGTTSTAVYEPGHVQIGAVWNRDGSPDQRERSGDWARALAHELGHYALYLDDNYIGLNNAGQLINVATCPGAMSDPYGSTSIDFRPNSDWLPGCADTLSNRNTGRSDWATIERFYDTAVAGFQFHQPAHYTALPGPSVLPLAVTQFVEPQPPASAGESTLALQLTTVEGEQYNAGAAARGFAFSADGSQIRDLGQPSQSQLIARGVGNGDQLCVYDGPATRLGCATVGANALTLGTRSDWRPDVVLTPIPTRTLEISVAADGVGAPAPTALKARLFPSDTAQGAVDADLQLVNGQYVGRFTPTEPVLQGYVRVWVENDTAPRRETVTDYAVGGNPAPPRRPPRRSLRKAPVISSDGQVILFTDGLDFKAGEFFSLQTVTQLPPDPPTARVLGQGYRLIASNPAPSLAGVGINMAFAAEDVPSGSDGWVALYYYPPDGSGWQRLSALPGTAGSTEVNAQVAGPGIYALMASLPLELSDQGWNQVQWPGATAALPGALSPLSGSYSHLYGYDANDSSDPWKVYAPGAPSWVNEQSELEQGKLYRIYVTAPLTAPVRPTTAAQLQAQPQAINSLPIAPATYYTTLAATTDFTPTADLPVVAKVHDTVCGETTTRQLADGSIVFAIDVFASGAGATANCGTDDVPITFTIGDYTYPVQPLWDNTQLHALQVHKILLPIILTTPSSDENGGDLSSPSRTR